jgi:hypothetical protein
VWKETQYVRIVMEASAVVEAVLVEGTKSRVTSSSIFLAVNSPDTR